MIQSGIAREIAERSGEARFRVHRAEDEPVEPRQHERTGAHRARLERHIDRATRESPRMQRGGPRSNRQDLSVRRRIVVALSSVPRAAEDLIAPRDDRADRHVAPRERESRILEGELHHRSVVSRRGGLVAHSVRVEIAKPLVRDTEEVRDLVLDRVHDRSAELVLVTCDARDSPPIQRDRVREHAGVELPFGEGDPVVSAEQAWLPRRRPVLDHDLDVLETLEHPRRHRIDRLRDQLLEPAAIDHHERALRASAPIDSSTTRCASIAVISLWSYGGDTSTTSIPTRSTRPTI